MCEPATHRARLPVWIAAAPFLLIILFAWVGYANTLGVPFLFDDHHNIAKNQNIHMSTLTLDGLTAAAFESPSNRPISNVSFALNYLVGGSDVTGFHIVNVTIHMLNGVLVYLLLMQVCPGLLSGRWKDRRFGYIPFALSAALIFVSHPVQTQSVTYIVQRMTSMCAMFYLASLLMYIWGRAKSRTPKARLVYWGGAFALWVLAIGSKEMAVTLPAAVLLYEWIVVAQGKIRLRRRNVLGVFGSGLLMFAVVLVFKYNSLLRLFTAGFDRRDFTMYERLLTESRGVVHYISLIAWPAPSRLTLIYDFPISTSLFHPLTTILSILLLIGVFSLGVLSAKRNPLVAFAILWFGLHLLVESTIIPLELIYEHRLYLPLVGGASLAVWVIFFITKKPRIAFALTFALSMVLTAGTITRNHTWQDQLTLWLDNAQKQPGEPRVQYNTGMAYKNKGMFEEAIESLGRAIELEPRHQEAHILRGGLQSELGKYQLSLDNFDAVIAMNDDDLGKWGGHRAEAYLQRGQLFLTVNEPLRAYRNFNQSLALRLNHVTTLSKRAISLITLGRHKEAIVDLKRVIELSPLHAIAQSNLAWLYATSPDEFIRNGQLAVQHARIACEQTNWSSVGILSTYAASLAEAGDFESAIQWQLKCIELAPEQARQRYRDRLELYRNQIPYRTE